MAAVRGGRQGAKVGPVVYLTLPPQGSPKGLQQTSKVCKSRRCHHHHLRMHHCSVSLVSTIVRKRSGRNCRPRSWGHGLGFLRVNKKMNSVEARIAFALIPLVGILLAMTVCGMLSPTVCIRLPPRAAMCARACRPHPAAGPGAAG
jgi:hypothetical protein